MEVTKTPTKGKSTKAKTTKAKSTAKKATKVNKKVVDKLVKKIKAKDAAKAKEIKKPNYNRMTKANLIKLVVDGEQTTADLTKATDKIKTLNKRIRTKNAEIRELKATKSVTPTETAEYKELEKNAYEAMLESQSKIEAATVALTDMNEMFAKKSNEVELYKEQVEIFKNKISSVKDKVKNNSEMFLNRETQLIEEKKAVSNLLKEVQEDNQLKSQIISDARSYVETVENDLKAEVNKVESLSTRIEDITEQLQEKEKVNSDLVEQINQLKETTISVTEKEINPSSLPNKSLVKFIKDWLMYIQYTKGPKTKILWFVLLMFSVASVFSLASFGVVSLTNTTVGTIVSGVFTLFILYLGFSISKENK